jgi:hypothetical protein
VGDKHGSFNRHLPIAPTALPDVAVQGKQADRENVAESWTVYLSAARPMLYLVVVLGVVVATYIYTLRFEGIFSCQANGYGSDRYLAYCQATHYGDYEHGAFWFGLEPSSEGFLASADVLFLGDSRLQFAFSTAATSEWFSAAATRFFLMGFLYVEDSYFAEALLSKFKPSAKVYVINADPFFATYMTEPARTVMHDASARSQYETKRLWQFVQRPICRGLPAICGNHLVIFRSRETGMYWASGLAAFTSSPVTYDRVPDPDVVAKYAATAREFLSRAPVDQACVILTDIPTVKTKRGTAVAIAEALGMELIAPELEALQTYDGSHLDRPSAERWSEAFFRAAAPKIQRCLHKTQRSSAGRSP